MTTTVYQSIFDVQVRFGGTVRTAFHCRLSVQVLGIIKRGIDDSRSHITAKLEQSRVLVENFTLKCRGLFQFVIFVFA